MLLIGCSASSDDTSTTRKLVDDRVVKVQINKTVSIEFLPMKVSPALMGRFEISQEQYQAVIGSNPSVHVNPQHPVDAVSWNEASMFCAKLSELTGLIFRLPTELEWEINSRGGTTTTYHYGNSEDDLVKYAWFDKNSKETTHPVGQKAPNNYGFYDTSGNVAEWVQDWYGQLPDPLPSLQWSGPPEGTEKVIRGGGYTGPLGNAKACAPGVRFHFPPEASSPLFGFRVVLERHTSK